MSQLYNLIVVLRSALGSSRWFRFALQGGCGESMQIVVTNPTDDLSFFFLSFFPTFPFFTPRERFRPPASRASRSASSCSRNFFVSISLA